MAEYVGKLVGVMGAYVGRLVGVMGASVGSLVGAYVGRLVGVMGAYVGRVVGVYVGRLDGVLVGAIVGSESLLMMVNVTWRGIPAGLRVVWLKNGVALIVCSPATSTLHAK